MRIVTTRYLPDDIADLCEVEPAFARVVAEDLLELQLGPDEGEFD